MWRLGAGPRGGNTARACPAGLWAGDAARPSSPGASPVAVAAVEVALPALTAGGGHLRPGARQGAGQGVAPGTGPRRQGRGSGASSRRAPWPPPPRRRPAPNRPPSCPHVLVLLAGKVLLHDALDGAVHEARGLRGGGGGGAGRGGVRRGVGGCAGGGRRQAAGPGAFPGPQSKLTPLNSPPSSPAPGRPPAPRRPRRPRSRRRRPPSRRPGRRQSRP
jgi:hypothetical protein